MTDHEPLGDPWPVPEGTLMTAELSLALTMISEVHLGYLEKGALDLIDADPGDVRTHDLAVLLDRLDAFASKLKEISAEVAEHFCQTLPFRTTSVGYADTCAFIPRWGGERKGWENDRLRSDVRRQMIDALVGPGLNGLEIETVLDAVEKVVSFIGGNMKTTGLRGLGLVPDAYCTVEHKAPSVQVVRS